MGLFGFGKKEGGLMDVIRCDEQEYLVWKWRPAGADVNSTRKENSIRYGSSLRVKDGEVAVFVYRQKSGAVQDYIEGPYDDILKTANFPVLANLVGAAWGGSSPFQAEVYFINLSGNVQLKFAVPYFDVFDPRFADFAAPFSVRGTITFNITDYKAFIKLNRLINFDLEQFKIQVRDAVINCVKGFVSNAPATYGIPVRQMERKVMELGDLIKQKLAPEFIDDFGVNLKRFDISAIEPDKESEGWRKLIRMTADQQEKITVAQTDLSVKNAQDMQSINAENMAETLRIQREEAQRAQKLQTETNFIGAHALNQQTDVLKTGATSLGQMGSFGMGGDSMNPAGMMAGMMMGGALGNQMAGMMNQMGGAMQGQMNTPPPMPQAQYMVSANGQQSGPFNMQQMQQLVQNGQLNRNTYVWKQGMAQWEMAGNVAELSALFAPASQMAPPPPPMP